MFQADKKGLQVYLHTEDGFPIAPVQFVDGKWEPPDEVHAEAMRRALPGLKAHGVREVIKGEVAPVPEAPEGDAYPPIAKRPKRKSD